VVDGNTTELYFYAARDSKGGRARTQNKHILKRLNLDETRIMSTRN
jgi:hypothetical protein